MKKSTIIIVVVLVALGLGVAALMMREDKSTTQTTGVEEPVAATITYTDDGFSPASVTVAAGTTVSVENSSSGELQFSSDDHPTHKDNPELNQAAIPSGDTLNFVVNEPGTWGYHDHLNPTKTGTIVVEAE